ncbi:MAG TPA: hypothetical protein VIO94_17090, partial [Phenylobacterium sp.]
LAAQAADGYAAAGFSVVWQDVILSEDLLEATRRLARWNPGVVVLCPGADTVAARDVSRHKSGYDIGLEWTPGRFVQMVASTPRIGLWLDNSALTIPESIEAILANSAQTRAGL